MKGRVREARLGLWVAWGGGAFCAEWGPQRVLSRGRVCPDSVAHRCPLAAVGGTDWEGEGWN